MHMFLFINKYYLSLSSGEASKQIHDYKFKLQKAEQDIATLEGMVSHLLLKYACRQLTEESLLIVQSVIVSVQV